MPVIFKSKATGDLWMVSAHAQALLDGLNKRGDAAGILRVEEMAAALATLKALPDEPARDPDLDPDDEGVHEPRHPDPEQDGVSLRKRAWPLIRMIEQSLAANEPIVWGV
ncbi:MAG TPA: DUF1840 family protein [Aquabacterium sp.]|uniref:DUF1840 family protein n=1 Tax=Aquabacterium sp. TaxID=1872578 RepID=UPI002D9FED5A|nr:DUF1840 family protein [Aquabacterium sp.]HET6788067.1 DUF1840 family protein [Aquabacterium sp.]HEX5373994.1 DUF1840 family protein [Aquabacterium sp.]